MNTNCVKVLQKENFECIFECNLNAALGRLNHPHLLHEHHLQMHDSQEWYIPYRQYIILKDT